MRLSALILVALALASCSSSGSASTTNGTPPLGGPNYRWNVRVANRSRNPVLVTRFWSYSWDPFWHVEDVPTCVDAGGAIDASIQYSSDSGPQAKLGFQAKRDRSCSGSTIFPGGSFEGPKCALDFSRRATITSNAAIDGGDGKYAVNQECDVR